MKRRFRHLEHFFPILEGKNIYNSNSRKITRSLIKYLLSQKGNEEQPKLLFLTDMNQGLERLEQEIKSDPYFSKYETKIITSDNVSEEQEAINNYARGKIDCDILFASPCLEIGVRLNGLFDIVIIDTMNNSSRVQSPEEIVQMMTRDADCSEIIWQDYTQDKLSKHAINWRIPEPKNWSKIDEEEYRKITKTINDIYGQDHGILIRNFTTGAIEPTHAWITKRLIRTHNASIPRRENRKHFVRTDCEKLGANWFTLEQTKQLLPKAEKIVPAYVSEQIEQILLTGRNHTPASKEQLNKISQAFGEELQTVSKEQIAQYDQGHYFENEYRQNNLSKSSDDLGNEQFFFNPFINEVLEMAMTYANMRILTDKQFKESEAFKRLEEDFPRFQQLAQNLFQIYEPKQLETALSALEWTSKLLNKWNFKTELKREAQSNPNGSRMKLYKEAQKEHKRDFNKWARENKTEGKQMRYSNFVWAMLKDNPDFRFGRQTKAYIRTFPHLAISEYPERRIGTSA